MTANNKARKLPKRNYDVVYDFAVEKKGRFTLASGVYDVEHDKMLCFQAINPSVCEILKIENCRYIWDRPKAYRDNRRLFQRL